MRMPRRFVFGQVVMLLLASAGCAAKTTRPWMPERVRAELGAVAVVVPPAPPERSLAYPVPSRPGAAVAGGARGWARVSSRARRASAAPGSCGRPASSPSGPP